MIIICLTKDDSLHRSFPLSHNSWSLGNIPTVSGFRIFSNSFKIKPLGITRKWSKKPYQSSTGTKSLKAYLLMEQNMSSFLKVIVTSYWPLLQGYGSLDVKSRALWLSTHPHPFPAGIRLPKRRREYHGPPSETNTTKVHWQLRLYKTYRARWSGSPNLLQQRAFRALYLVFSVWLRQLGM